MEVGLGAGVNTGVGVGAIASTTGVLEGLTASTAALETGAGATYWDEGAGADEETSTTGGV